MLINKFMSINPVIFKQLLFAGIGAQVWVREERDFLRKRDFNLNWQSESSFVNPSEEYKLLQITCVSF